MVYIPLRHRAESSVPPNKYRPPKQSQSHKQYLFPRKRLPLPIHGISYTLLKHFSGLGSQTVIFLQPKHDELLYASCSIIPRKPLQPRIQCCPTGRISTRYPSPKEVGLPRLGHYHTLTSPHISFTHFSFQTPLTPRNFGTTTCVNTRYLAKAFSSCL